jgi:hypothetical protein
LGRLATLERLLRSLRQAFELLNRRARLARTIRDDQCGDRDNADEYEYGVF